jgi:CheY-like chemotaxis protein
MQDQGRQATTRAVRTIRLDDEELTALLDKLDAKAAEEGKKIQRIERFSYRQKGCLLHMQQPGAGSPTTFHVPTRDLSATGVSFLHGGYVHVGTRCVIQLISMHGTWSDVRGRVSRCNYVTNQIHEVGVRFDEPIQPGEFCAGALKLRVLLAEDDPLIAKLAQTYLIKLNAEVEYVSDGQAAVDAALAGKFEIVLMDISMPVMDGLAAARELRKRGYRGHIIAATAHTAPTTRMECIEAGCDEYLAKPFSREKLAAILDHRKAEPLLSTFHDDPSLSELITAFVRTLPEKIRVLEEACAASDWSTAELTARSLKGEGGSYGFDPISESAAQVESAATSRKDLKTLQEKTDELVRWCRLAKGGPGASD